jgi:polar amino acid transport system substrate-binding protein
MGKKIFTGLAALSLSLAMTACSFGADSGAKVYKIASDVSFTPFEFEDESGTYVGIDVEILARIAEAAGFAYEVEYVGFDAAIQAVASGESDGAIMGMSIIEERKSTYDFSDSYYNAGLTVGMKVANASGISKYEDLAGLTIGAKLATTSQFWCEDNARKYRLTCQTYDDSIGLYDALDINAIDALLDDSPSIAYAISQGRELAMPIDSIESIAGLGFAVKKGENPELLEMFNQGLAEIKANGIYLEILTKWGAESGSVI